ncbi:MAG: hypothetical protein AAB211_10500 [Pseudomonadota bacterium]
MPSVTNVNTAALMRADLSTSSGLSIQTISRLSEIFARHEKVSSVVLYGSRAK